MILLETKYQSTIIIILVLIVGQSCIIKSAKILSLMNLASPSHHVFNRVLSRALAERGHQVTVLSADADEPPLPKNLTYIKMEGVYESIRNAFDFEALPQQSVFNMIFTMYDLVNVFCEAEMKSEGAQKMLKSQDEKFDLIIMEAGWAECFYGFIPYFGSPPVVTISAFGIPSWAANVMGTPENPSYLPNYFLPYTSDMNFLQRLNNFVISSIHDVYYEYYHIPNQEAIFRKYSNSTFKTSFWEVERNFSIFLTNTVPGLDEARPLSPNVISIGGMHIRDKPNRLPEDLQRFLDNAKDGFVFFSMGSNVRSDQLTVDTRQAFLDAFEELKPLRFVWKFESDLPGQLDNIKIGKWLPQSDILAHPNIRAFISHCGKLSSTEAIYRGVPIIGIPFFLDQILIMEKLKSRGVAVQLDYMSLTKENILQAFKEILYNDSYQTNMKKMSAIFRDQPDTSLERALFWIDFVIRHGGAPHLKPASTKLYLHQYLLLDVVLVLATAGILVMWVIYYVLTNIYKILKAIPKQKLKHN